MDLAADGWQRLRQHHTITSVDNPSVGSGTVLNQVKQEYNDFGQIVTSAQQQDGSVIGGSPTVELVYEDGSESTVRQVVYIPVAVCIE